MAADLGVARGLEPPDWTGSDDVLRSLGDSVAAFKGMSEETIGPLGVRNAAETAGA